MSTSRNFFSAMTMVAGLMAPACGSDSPGTPPTSPTPPPAPPGQQVTANAYIMPDAVKMNDWAFGDEPVVVYTGERLRWVNLDQTAHDIVADTPGATDFVRTETLAPGAEHSLTVTRTGTTKIHCTIHPNMVGTLIVRQH